VGEPFPIDACAIADSKELLATYAGCGPFSPRPNPAWHADKPTSSAIITETLRMTYSLQTFVFFELSRAASLRGICVRPGQVSASATFFMAAAPTILEDARRQAPGHAETDQREKQHDFEIPERAHKTSFRQMSKSISELYGLSQVARCRRRDRFEQMSCWRGKGDETGPETT
jgi:hypothetical protein